MHTKYRENKNQGIMKIHFTIEYHTNWGEDIRIRLTKLTSNGERLNEKECPLETFDGKEWDGEITFSSSNVIGIEYKYALYKDNALVWTEWEVAPHRIIFSEKADSYIVNDSWRPIPEDLPLFSSAFTECIGKHNNKEEQDKTYPETLQLRIVEPRLRKGEHLAICGNMPQLGSWVKPVRLSLIGLQEWAINIDASLLYNTAEYKYVITNDKNDILKWEDGPNRKIRCPKLPNKQMWIKTDNKPSFDIPNWKTAGIVLPVFSLKTNNSFGIGDFGDLKALISWAEKVKMHAIQILPINDTTMTGTWTDSYPYNSISIYALHPIYCNLNALPPLEDKLEKEKYMMRQQKLNQLAQIDYDTVFKLKMSYINKVYKQEGKNVLASAEFKKYFEENKDWLVPYAAFSHLRDTYGTPDFNLWAEHSTYDKQEIEKLCSQKSKDYESCAFYFFIQYELHLQLSDVRKVAREKGIFIKGDIPIGISRTSVEAWTEPELFNLNSQAGAPPDDFSVNGQNWGFPTYNWEKMAEDGYSWWLRRFKKMAEYFDAYRIDHILGFFRIWEIPMDSVHGLLGQFSPSLPLSVNEIEEYGLKFRKDLMTKPFISEEVLEKVFDYKKDIIKIIYLYPRTDGRYEFKEQYNTQRKIEAAFKDKTDEESISIRDGLYSLLSNVLFISDNKFDELYHPRISAQHSLVYHALPRHEQEAFNKLYDDYYYKRHDDFWYAEAMKKLPALTQSTRMLVCAEDLGMVPSCVPWVMDNLRILSLEIQTMPKALGLEFGQLYDNPYRSVATISTHDMSPLRLWWEEDHERAQKFYNSALHKDGPAPKEAPGWLCEDIVSRHLFSPSALCILSYQDWLSISEKYRYKNAEDERINIPANPRHYWRYRMHTSIEQLMQAQDLNEKISTLIENSGRA